MKKLAYQNVKGTLDYLPREEKIRREIKKTIEDVFIQYGCKPIETPILNYQELLASKYAGGAEILEEMYTLSDRGKRELALRYDLTIPFAKVIAMNPTIKMPFKRYEIGKVFRDGPTKTGRYREFTQCDVDIVGVSSQIAEVELMVMALDVFNKLNLDVTIQYNNRNLLVGLLGTFQVPKDKINRVILIIDKMEKIELEEIKKELFGLGMTESVVVSIQSFLKKPVEEMFGYFQTLLDEDGYIEKGLKEITELTCFLIKLGIEDKCIFNPFLARGLEIYTGTIYEIFLNDKRIKSSIGSGGRYDHAIGGLLCADKEYATVGISLGLDVILSAIQMSENQDIGNSDIDYYVVSLGKQVEAFMIAKDLRDKGYNVELELGKKKISKALEQANREGVRKVILIGEEEVRGNYYKIKEMINGEERNVPFIY